MGFYPSRAIRDAEYLLQRAETEARLAMEASDERAEEAHHVLASAYLDRLFSDQPESGARADDEAVRHHEMEEALVSAVASAFMVYPPLPRDAGISHLLEELQEVESEGDGHTEPTPAPIERRLFQSNELIQKDSALAA